MMLSAEIFTQHTGPSCQSVVSLTSSLRVIFVNCFSGFNIQYSDIFCWNQNWSAKCQYNATGWNIMSWVWGVIK